MYRGNRVYIGSVIIHTAVLVFSLLCCYLFAELYRQYNETKILRTVHRFCTVKPTHEERSAWQHNNSRVRTKCGSSFNVIPCFCWGIGFWGGIMCFWIHSSVIRSNTLLQRLLDPWMTFRCERFRCRQIQKPSYILAYLNSYLQSG